LKRVFEQIEYVYSLLPIITYRLQQPFTRSHIQGRVQISSSLKQRKFADELSKSQDLIRAVHQDLLRTAATVHSDGLLTKDVRQRVDGAVADTIAATRIVDGFRNPHTHGAALRDHADFPLEYAVFATHTP
jgi:nucleoporin p58/p45